MISPAGRSGTVIRPKAFATAGGTSVAVSSLRVMYSVGMIARAEIGMPVEDLWKVTSAGPDSPARINAMGSEIFSGYVDAPSIQMSGESLHASCSLVHAARDLDEASMFGPGAHPASTEDFTVLTAFASGRSDRASSESVLSRRDLRFDVTKNVAQEILDYISSLLDHLATSSKRRSVPKNLEHAMRTLSEQAPRVVNAIARTKVDGDCSIPAGGMAGPLSDAASAFARNTALGAMRSGSSTWAVMAALMSSFGLTILCLPDGKCMVAPDYSGCRPPGGNEIRPGSVSKFFLNASSSRPPSAVVAVGYGPASAGRSDPVSHAPVASFAPKTRPSSTSGIYTTGLPSWMVPASRTQLGSPPPPIPDILGDNWAKQIYYQIANVNRSMTVTMPFSPDMSPGTTYRVFPSSSAKFFSGGGTGLQKSYSGYCHSVTHSMTEGSNDVSTTAVFRNIFEDSEDGAMLDGSPMFSDQKPFTAPP